MSQTHIRADASVGRSGVTAAEVKTRGAGRLAYAGVRLST